MKKKLLCLSNQLGYGFSFGRYQLDKPTTNDRLNFWEKMVGALLSIQLEQSTDKELTNLPELPKAPKEVSHAKLSELKAKSEAEQHALRRLRMCLRDVCNRYVV